MQLLGVGQHRIRKKEKKPANTSEMILSWIVCVEWIIHLLLEAFWCKMRLLVLLVLVQLTGVIVSPPADIYMYLHLDKLIHLQYGSGPCKTRRTNVSTVHASSLWYHWPPDSLCLMPPVYRILFCYKKLNGICLLLQGRNSAAYGVQVPVQVPRKDLSFLHKIQPQLKEIRRSTLVLNTDTPWWDPCGR